MARHENPCFRRDGGGGNRPGLLAGVELCAASLAIHDAPAMSFRFTRCGTDNAGWKQRFRALPTARAFMLRTASLCGVAALRVSIANAGRS
jgi:hypothetical protein